MTTTMIAARRVQRVAPAALVQLVPLMALCSVVAPPLRAQIRASERATVSQVLDGTTITIDYSRPAARGRDSLFGKVVHWGATWTPGANWATTIEADREIRLNGQPLAKGKYSVWMVPRPSGAWTVMLSSDAHHFHIPPADSATMVLRFAATPERSDVSEEVLTWSFPALAPDAATLRMQWGTTSVPIRVTTQPGRLATVPADDRLRYVGSYAFTTDDKSRPSVRISDEGGALRVRHVDGKLYGLYDYYELIPDGPQRFRRALYADGKLAEVEADFTLVFDVADGRARGFDLVGATGKVVGRAVRVGQ